MNKLTILTFVVALLIFAGGVVVGAMNAGSANSLITNVMRATKPVVKENIDTDNPVQTKAAQAAASGNGSAVAFTLNLANLPDTQKAFLRTMGIAGDALPVTNNMLVCAEAAVGSDRMLAIKNGATPTMGEGLKLAGCYKK